MKQEESEVNKISYMSTLCIVSPESNVMLWGKVTKARTDSKDPGLFRWPPHINLLYPFYEIIPSIGQQHQSSKETNKTIHEYSENKASAILSKIRKATARINPFYVSIRSFGCFGGKNRGVLWLYPSTASSSGEEPIKQLHYCLHQEFSNLSSNNRKSIPFHPHMTISHFENLSAAENAKKDLEEEWIDDGITNNPMDNEFTTFYVKEFYMLQRQGDYGQFHIVATIPLGNNTITSSMKTNDEDEKAMLHDISSDGFILHTPPKPFFLMPTVEEDWVRAERMKLKDRSK